VEKEGTAKCPRRNKYIVDWLKHANDAKWTANKLANKIIMQSMAPEVATCNCIYLLMPPFDGYIIDLSGDSEGLCRRHQNRGLK